MFQRLGRTHICYVGFPGLCSAPFTSFNEDGSLDVDGGVASVIQGLVDTGVKYAFVGGTTGESFKLTQAERKQLLERWVAVIAEKGCDMTVIAHVGCESLQDTVDLARHAAACGVKAIGVMPPVFFKPPSLDALVDVSRVVGLAQCMVHAGLNCCGGVPISSCLCVRACLVC